jgi:hypothetical protein
VGNVGGEDIGANVGSEQNTRATGTALAFTTTQAYLFTISLASISCATRTCTFTVNLITAWFRLGAMVAYRPNNFRVALMRLSLPIIPQPTETPLQKTTPLAITIPLPTKRSKTAPKKSLTDRKPRVLRSQSDEPRIRSILNQAHSSPRPQIGSAHSRKHTKELHPNHHGSRHPGWREPRHEFRPTTRALPPSDR